jgi:uncharacterized membrane protein
MKRLPFVDALRGLAVAGMLVIHQSEWWLTPVARRREPFAVAIAPMLLGSFAVIYFLLRMLQGPEQVV